MMWLIAPLKEAGKNLEPKSQVITNTQTTANPGGFYIQPLLNVTTGIIENMGKEFQKNAELAQQKAQEPYYQREMQIRKISQAAEIQARNDTESFDAEYKKPAECYNIENHATRVNCSNQYMRARAAFDKEHN